MTSLNDCGSLGRFAIIRTAFVDALHQRGVSAAGAPLGIQRRPGCFSANGVHFEGCQSPLTARASVSVSETAADAAAREIAPRIATIAAAGLRRMPTAPRLSTKAHSAAIRLTTSSGGHYRRHCATTLAGSCLKPLSTAAVQVLHLFGKRLARPSHSARFLEQNDRPVRRQAFEPHGRRLSP